MNNEIETLIHSLQIENQSLNEQIHQLMQILENSKIYNEAKILDNLPIIIFELDLYGKITFVNQHTYGIFGYSPNDFKIGIYAEQSVIQQDRNRLRRLFKSRLEGAILTGNEFTALKKDGNTFPVLIYTNQKKQNSEVIGLTGLMLDISDRKKEELELIKAKAFAEESDKLKTALLTNISHEIRTPMNAIIGFSEMLENKNLSEVKRKQYSQIIRSQTLYLFDVINDIMDASKLETNQVEISTEYFSVNKLLDELAELFCANKEKENKQNIEIKVSKGLPDEREMIKTDPELLRQILTKLISNAIKYTKRGFVEFGYRLKDDETLIFHVKDTGIGIKPEKQKIIFDYFRQTEESYTRIFSGNGLGLSIAQGYTKLLGGRISVESEINKGSTFYFTIPFKQVEDDDKEVATLPENIYWKDRVFLVVEDDLNSYLYLESVLELTGAQVMRAPTGKHAIDICKLKKIDLILMDIQLPDINGFEATKKIREFNKTIPIIAQTAFAMSDDHKKCLEIGCNDFISKPIPRKEILTKIHALLK
jgi:PAS domain S-box-containing protein